MQSARERKREGEKEPAQAAPAVAWVVRRNGAERGREEKEGRKKLSNYCFFYCLGG